jgi:ligand-binding SRPBCC domain-containing protein
VKVHTLQTENWLPLPIDKVFEFFGDAGNLDPLTPPWLHFQIITPRPITMGQGTLIDYRLKIHKIPVRWRSEITVWEPPHLFVDEQRKGPYIQWIHRHEFATRGEGTVIRDHIDYAVPGLIFEPLLHHFFVKPDIQTIFAFRQQKIQELLKVKMAV